MFVFPPALAPPPPFPLVLETNVTAAFVAPGVQRADYRLSTATGPLVVHVVAVDPREPTIRFGVVVANDRLISAAETTSSMAMRTGAIAGLNADYYDIGQTNQPLGVVVQNAMLVRTPSKRVALEIGRDRSVRFGTFRFSGSVSYGTVIVPLTTVDEWPPQGGVSLLTPFYGTPKPVAGVRVAALTALSASAGIDGTYRVDAVGELSAPAPVRGPVLAFGPAALALAAPPNVGDTVQLHAVLDPPLAEMTAAVGGGPLLVVSGTPYDDPNAPAPEERNRRFPLSGAATLADGTVLLIAVDGRQPAQSIGLTRPEFAALMLGLGASDGMAFDSGGSATLVGRVLGDERASVLNAPSDGFERPVADGFFVYSDAPLGRNPHLVLSPQTFNALPGAVVALRAAVVDDAGHRLSAATVAPVRVAAGSGSHTIVVREAGGATSATLVYRTVPQLARIAIEPSEINAGTGATVRFHATGADSSGAPVELGTVAWSVTSGTIDAAGTYRAGTRDATIVASAGGVSASSQVRVGSRAQPLALFAARLPLAWTFATYPRGGAGSLSSAPDAPELQLSYDFTGTETAAYANGTLALPGQPLAFGLDVRGDGGGAGLRAAFTNRFGERRALTLARTIDWTGWRSLTLALPADLNPPVTLVSLYAVAALGGSPSRAAGTIAFRNPVVTVAGTP